jgi:hypothetical protein
VGLTGSATSCSNPVENTTETVESLTRVWMSVDPWTGRIFEVQREGNMLSPDHRLLLNDVLATRNSPAEVRVSQGLGCASGRAAMADDVQQDVSAYRWRPGSSDNDRWDEREGIAQ